MNVTISLTLFVLEIRNQNITGNIDNYVKNISNSVKINHLKETFCKTKTAKFVDLVKIYLLSNKKELLFV